jgi:nitrate/nitrite-specific signal transduction histidine kinase
MLRPLRTMNTAIKRISARNVHERLALRGPRDELRNLADTVDGLLERLDSAVDAQKSFVANAAHELTPVLCRACCHCCILGSCVGSAYMEGHP